jgi:hypothetical protein
MSRISRESRVEHQEKAAAIWSQLTASEKHGVRFGLFPNEKVLPTQNEGFDTHEICLALMTCAEKDGGMRA